MNIGHLRQAVNHDIDFLFNLANEQECRSNSFQMNRIGYNEHKRWFEERLKSTNCKLFIYLNDDERPIGQARLDKNENIAEISYSIIREYRGKGFGKKIVQLIEGAAIEDKDIKVLKAKVKINNIASRRIFEQSGYIASQNDGYVDYTKKVHEK